MRQAIKSPKALAFSLAVSLSLLAAPLQPAAAGESAPATPQVAQGTNDVNDPLEGLNRTIFNFNEFLYSLLLRPLTEFYVLMIPADARDGIRNFLDNLRTPVILGNDLLQGEPERAWITTQRFFINSTVGLGGLIDVAKMNGLEGHSEDLGQTFAVWGVPEGFYLVLPIFGPSNPRDAVGKFLDSYLDPMAYYLSNTNHTDYDYGRQAMLGLDEFSRVKDDLEKLKETSVDYYAAMRSISRQKRDAEIRNGKPREGKSMPDLNYDFNAELSPP